MAAIVGREAELAAVEAFLEQPASALRACVIEGDAGIGKTTLWLVAVDTARDGGLTVLASRPAETERALGNVVLGDLFAGIEPALLADLAPPRRRAFEAALLREEPDAVVDPLALGVAIVTLLSAMAARERVVLAIDDDQWIDASSAATLGFALRRLEDVPVRLLLARRRGAAAMPGLEETIPPERVERVEVGALSPGALQLLLRERLGITLSRPNLLHVHEVSGGNPLYAIELARARAGEGHVASTTSVPGSLGRLLDERLRGLDPEMTLALLHVAAHGRLPVDLVERLEIPSGAIQRAMNANLIAAEGGIVRFTHPLLASAVYERATTAHRRAVHRRLAEVEEDTVTRGRHLALAADTPDEMLAASLEQAARVASARGLTVSAADLAEHALRLTPSAAEAERAARAAATARALMAAGDLERGRAIARELVAAAPAGRRRAEALLLRAELESSSEALHLLAEALVEARGIPELEAAVHADLAFSGRFAFTEPPEWVEHHAATSLRLADQLDDDALRTRALSILALVRLDRLDPAALELAERAYRLAASLGDQQLLQRATQAVSHLLVWMGLLDRGRSWLEGQLAEWGARDELVRAGILWYLARVEIWAGRWEPANQQAQESLSIEALYGLDDPVTPYPIAELALLRGDLDVARDVARRAMALDADRQFGDYEAILAQCDLLAGNPAAAIPGFVRAEEATSIRGLLEPMFTLWRADYVEALLQLGRIDEAGRVLDDWEAAAKSVGRDRVLAEAVRCRGLIEVARGDLDAGVALLEQATHRSAAVGDPFGKARALLALGATRRRMRQKRSAREAIDAAVAGFEALGAAGWAAIARTELARVAGRRRIDGLSPSELSVATLAAQGRTNREIASSLFIGERTVSSHLTHVYAKLGVRSRTELARQLSSRADFSAPDPVKVPTS